MKNPPQYVGLLWLLWSALAVAIVTAIWSAVIDPEVSGFLGGSYIDDGALALKSSLAALSNVALIVTFVAAVGASVLAGIRHMLETSGSSGEGSAPERAVGDAGVDLRGGDGGVPEETLDRE